MGDGWEVTLFGSALSIAGILLLSTAVEPWVLISIACLVILAVLLALVLWAATAIGKQVSGGDE